MSILLVRPAQINGAAGRIIGPQGDVRVRARCWSGQEAWSGAQGAVGPQGPTGADLETSALRGATGTGIDLLNGIRYRRQRSLPTKVEGNQINQGDAYLGLRRSYRLWTVDRQHRHLRAPAVSQIQGPSWRTRASGSTGHARTDWQRSARPGTLRVLPAQQVRLDSGLDSPEPTGPLGPAGAQGRYGCRRRYRAPRQPGLDSALPDLQAPAGVLRSRRTHGQRLRVLQGRRALRVSHGTDRTHQRGHRE